MCPEAQMKRTKLGVKILSECLVEPQNAPLFLETAAAETYKDGKNTISQQPLDSDMSVRDGAILFSFSRSATGPGMNSVQKSLAASAFWGQKIFRYNCPEKHGFLSLFLSFFL